MNEREQILEAMRKAGEPLNAGKIAAAGLDVLETEPMAADNPLREVLDPEKILITPHIAWATVEARSRLMKIIEDQVSVLHDQWKRK